MGLESAALYLARPKTRPNPGPGDPFGAFSCPGGGALATPLQNIDRDLSKLAALLHAAIMREDHAAREALRPRYDYWLDKRLLLRSASV